MSATPVSQKEVVRLLSIEHGHKRAAELTGVPYDLVRQWSVRGKWKSSQNVTERPIAVATANVQNDLAEHERKTKLGLATYAKRQAEHLATEGKLSDHGAFRNLAAGSSTLHGWNEGKQTAVFSLNVLNLNMLGDTEDTTLH